MSLLLHINTALERAYVGFSRNDIAIDHITNDVQKEHGTFLQPSISELSKKLGLPLSEIDAVSVMNGPGSYTGLRVGLSAAKGICYALNKPLILISTLHWMAYPFKNRGATICSMIDARRQEVFTARYDASLNVLMLPCSLIIDNAAFTELDAGPMIFTGNGRNKLTDWISGHYNAIFPEEAAGFDDQIMLGWEAFNRKDFADLAYSEPFYVKGFHSTLKN
jgi:tRNA threonylcarbamoyladenosine biosynthesis protein TsaB